jgi:ribosomal silencing factor RsfS
MEKNWYMDVEWDNMGESPIITWLDPIKSGKRGIKFTVIRNLNLEKKVNEIVDVRKVGFQVREMDQIQEDLVYCMNVESWNGSLYSNKAGNMVRYRTNGECAADGTFRLVRDEKNPSQFKMYNVRTQRTVGVGGPILEGSHKAVVLEKESDSKNQLWVMSKSARSKGVNSTFHFVNVGTSWILDAPTNKDHQMSVYRKHHKKINQAFYLKVAGKYVEPKPVDVRMEGFRVVDLEQFKDDLVYCIKAEFTGHALYSTKDNNSVRHGTSEDCGEESLFRVIHDKTFIDEFVVKFQNIKTQKIVTAGKTTHQTIYLKEDLTGVKGQNTQRWIMTPGQRSTFEVSFFNIVNVESKHILDVESGEKGDRRMIANKNHHFEGNQAFSFTVIKPYIHADYEIVDVRKMGFRVREMDQIQEDLVYCINVEGWNGSLYSNRAGNMVRYNNNSNCGPEKTFRLVRDEKNPSQFKMYNVRTQRTVGVGGKILRGNHKGVVLEKESDSKNQLWVMSKSARSKGVNSTFHFVNVGTNWILDAPANKDHQMSVYFKHHKKINQAFYLQVAGEYVEPKPVDVRMEGFRVVDLEQFKDDLVYCIKAEHSGNSLYSSIKNTIRHGTSKNCGEESLFRVIQDKTFTDKFVVKFQNIKTQMIVTAGKIKRQAIYLKEDLTGVEGQNTQRWIMTLGQRSTFEVSFFNIVNVDSGKILDVEYQRKDDQKVITWHDLHFEGNQAFSFTVIKPYVHADYEIMKPKVEEPEIEEPDVEDPEVLKFGVVDPNDCSIPGSDCSNFFKNLFSDFDENQHYCIAPLTSNNELEFSTSCILNTTFRFVRSSEFENAFRIVYSKNNTELLTYDNNLSNIMISEAKDNKKMLQRWNISQSKNGTFSIQNLENNNYLTYMVPDMEDKAYNLGLSKTPDANGRSSFVLIKQPSFTPEFSSNQLYCLQFNKKITKTTLVPSLESNTVARTNSDCQPEDLWRLIPANRASHSYYLVSFMGHRVLSEGRSQNITLEKLKYLERQAWEPVKSNSGIFSFKNGQTGAILALTNDGEVALVDGDEVMDVQSRYFQVKPMPCSKALD